MLFELIAAGTVGGVCGTATTLAALVVHRRRHYPQLDAVPDFTTTASDLAAAWPSNTDRAQVADLIADKLRTGHRVSSSRRQHGWSLRRGRIR